MYIVSGWENPLALLKHELVQLEYEGCIVPESVKEKIAGLHPVYDAFNEQKLRQMYAALENLSRSPDYNYVQPNELEAIRKERPDGPRQLP